MKRGLEISSIVKLRIFMFFCLSAGHGILFTIAYSMPSVKPLSYIYPITVLPAFLFAWVGIPTLESVKIVIFLPRFVPTSLGYLLCVIFWLCVHWLVACGVASFWHAFKIRRSRVGWARPLCPRGKDRVANVDHITTPDN